MWILETGSIILKSLDEELMNQKENSHFSLLPPDQFGAFYNSRFFGTDTGSHPCSAETAGLFAPPPRILHLHPSIQFIPIPDAAAYQMVRALRVSHPVISLPLPNTAAAPTYILGESVSHIHSCAMSTV